MVFYCPAKGETVEVKNFSEAVNVFKCRKCCEFHICENGPVKQEATDDD
jgi:hypothetical protein